MVVRGLLALACVMGVSACGATPSLGVGASHEVTVYYEAAGSYQEVSVEETCYTDGDPVTATIRDESGDIVATIDMTPDAEVLHGVVCSHEGSGSVPDSKFYTISVESKPGEVTVDADKLAANGYRVDLNGF